MKIPISLLMTVAVSLLVLSGCEQPGGGNAIGISAVTYTRLEVRSWVGDIPFVDTLGQRSSVFSFRSDAYLIGFVESSCSSREATTALAKEAARLSGSVKVVEISIGESDCANVVKCAQQRGPKRLRNLIVLCDGNGRIRKNFKVIRSGCIFVVDGAGQVKAIGSFRDMNRLTGIAQDVMAEAEARRRELYVH